MGIPVRNESQFYPDLGSESGQGLIEYILVLVVTIGLVLGLAVQFNSAFKTWANNYFGDYLACLLETGELPSAGGGGGATAASCESLFKEFSLADGRPANLSGPTGGGGGPGGGGGGGGAGATGGGDRETQRHGANGAAGNYSQIRSSRSGSARNTASTSKRQKLKDDQGASTGDMSAKGYGNAYSATNKKLKTGVRRRLDNGFAFQKPDEEKGLQRVASGSRKSKDEAGRKARLTLNSKVFKKNQVQEESGSISFAGFLKFILIAAIIIAIVMFLGGQALQIGKSME